MGKVNYNDEEYIETSTELFDKLKYISDTLTDNLKTSEKSYYVEEIIKAKSFNKLWDLTTNNDENKYSKNEYKGIYIFAAVEDNKVDVKYIGISQTIKRRFFHHTRRTTRQEATWAYLMINHEHKDKNKIEKETLIPFYQKKFIYPLKFTFYQIDNDMLLHFAESFCVNHLKSYWNTFKTH